MIVIKGNKAALLALVFTLFLDYASQPLAARERRGSRVEVTLADGSRVKGELLAVKGSGLVIHDQSLDRGFTVNIEQIKKIRIKRRSRILSGTAIGFVAGMGAGAAIVGSRRDPDPCEKTGAAIGGLMCWGAAVVIGGLTGAVLSLPEEISVNGREPVQMNAYLRHLQKHARY